MIDILGNIFGAVLVLAGAFFTYMSCVMVSEKKERQRKGLTDYYDNPIPSEKRKCLGGEDDGIN